MIDDMDWLDEMVDQPQNKESSPHGLVPMTRRLEESPHRSTDFDDRPIGTIIAVVHKKMVATKEKKGKALQGN